MSQHVLSLKELDKDALLAIIQKGIEIKRNPTDFYQACDKKGLFMLFQKLRREPICHFSLVLTKWVVTL